jgi:hypothetical protein
MIPLMIAPTTHLSTLPQIPHTAEREERVDD